MILVPCQQYDPYLFERLILPPYYLFGEKSAAVVSPFGNGPTIETIATEQPRAETNHGNDRGWKRSSPSATVVTVAAQQEVSSSSEETICTSTTCSSSVASVSSCSSSSSSTASLGTERTTSPGTTFSPTQRPRKVRFLQDDHGNMVVQQVQAVYQTPVDYRDEPIDQDEGEDTNQKPSVLWYRSKDFKAFRNHGKQVAMIAAASPYGQDLRQAWRLCWKKTKTKTGPTKQHTMQQQYSKLANSAARGLEVLVEPQLRQDRRTTIQRVLQTQTKLVQTSNLEGPQRAEILRATSVLSSKPTQLLATILAAGDAKVARSIQKLPSPQVAQ